MATKKKAPTKKKAVKTTQTKKRGDAIDRERGRIAVDEFMRKLEHRYREEIGVIREIILGASNKLLERVKWNAPSFFYGDGIDFAAFNLREREGLMLVMLFPKKMIEDQAGLLQGGWKDRRFAMFFDKKDIRAKKPVLEKIVKDWVKLMEG